MIFIIFHLFSYWIELTDFSFLVSFFISSTYEKICQCNSFLFDDDWKTPISWHFPKVTFDNIFGALSDVFSSQEWRETTVKTSFIGKSGIQGPVMKNDCISYTLPLDSYHWNDHSLTIWYLLLILLSFLNHEFKL